MSKYSDNIWAQEMGINLDDLLREHPYDLEQLQNTRAIARRGAEYWARERIRQRMEARVGHYEFDEKQLEIAVRSLNAQGSV